MSGSLGSGSSPVDHMEIGATDRARRHPHEHLARGWARRWHFRALERSTRRFEKHRAHIEKRAYTNDGVFKIKR